MSVCAVRRVTAHMIAIVLAAEFAGCVEVADSEVSFGEEADPAHDLGWKEKTGTAIEKAAPHSGGHTKGCSDAARLIPRDAASGHTFLREPETAGCRRGFVAVVAPVTSRGDDASKDGDITSAVS